MAQTPCTMGIGSAFSTNTNPGKCLTQDSNPINSPSVAAQSATKTPLPTSKQTVSSQRPSSNTKASSSNTRSINNASNGIGSSLSNLFGSIKSAVKKNPGSNDEKRKIDKGSNVSKETNAPNEKVPTVPKSLKAAFQVIPQSVISVSKNTTKEINKSTDELVTLYKKAIDVKNDTKREVVERKRDEQKNILEGLISNIAIAKFFTFHVGQKMTVLLPNNKTDEVNFFHFIFTILTATNISKGGKNPHRFQGGSINDVDDPTREEGTHSNKQTGPTGESSNENNIMDAIGNFKFIVYKDNRTKGQKISNVAKSGISAVKGKLNDAAAKASNMKEFVAKKTSDLSAKIQTIGKKKEKDDQQGGLFGLVSNESILGEYKLVLDFSNETEQRVQLVNNLSTDLNKLKTMVSMYVSNKTPILDSAMSGTVFKLFKCPILCVGDLNIITPIVTEYNREKGNLQEGMNREVISYLVNVYTDITNTLATLFNINGAPTKAVGNVTSPTSTPDPSTPTVNSTPSTKNNALTVTPPSTVSSTGGNKIATTKRIQIGRSNRIVYEGINGGQYIKQNGGFVRLKR